MMDELKQIIQYMMPVPSPCRLIRIGGCRDGAYLVPDDLSGIEACFSAGVADYKGFEDELATAWGIPSHLLDFSSDPDQFRTPLLPGIQFFRKLWLDVAERPDSISLTDWVNLDCSGDSDLLLQMDIEGAEYRNLCSVDDRILRRFRIVIIELHDICVRHSPDFCRQTIGPVMRRLAEHFECVHAHPNNIAGYEYSSELGFHVPRVIELSFLRKDRFANTPVTRRILPSVPHALDIDMNSDLTAPLVLPREWCIGGVRSEAESRQARRILESATGACLEEVFERLQALEVALEEQRRRVDFLSPVTRLVGRLKRLLGRAGA